MALGADGMMAWRGENPSGTFGVTFDMQETPINQGFPLISHKFRHLKGHMTDESIAAGVTINNWLVASVNGRAATCQCKCGSLRVISIASLLDGTAAPSSGCAPLSSEQVALRRATSQSSGLTPKIEPFS